MSRDFDFRDVAGVAASAFNTLRFEPDKGLNQALQTIQQQRTANRAKNKTVEYLESLGTPMGTRLAAMVKTGQLKGSQAYGYMFDLEKEARAEQRARELATFQNKLAMERDAAKPVKPSDIQVRHNMALKAGYPEGSDEYNQIVFKLPAQKQLSPEIQMKMQLAKQRNLEEGSPEFMNFVFGDEIPLFMPSGMNVDLYNKFDPTTQQAITASFGAGVSFPRDGTQADQQAYIESVMKVRDELGKEGTILKPTDPDYQEYVRNAFGKDFDMNQGIGGVIIKKKDGTLDFTSFKGGGVDVDVTVGTGDSQGGVTPIEQNQIDEMAKDNMVPEYADPNDPSKGFKRDPSTNQIQFVPAAGSKADFDRKKAALAKVKSDFTSRTIQAVKADNISNSVDTILDLVVGKKDKTGTRPSGKDAKYNKSTIKRLFTVDPPEAGVRGAAFGRLGFLSSQESVDVASLLTQIQSNIGFDRLQLMREMSTTGAGLGQVSNLELTQLNNSLVALQQELTPELLAKNLETVQTVYTKILNDPIALAIKEAPTKEEAMRLITLHNEVQAGSGDSSNIIFDGGDGNYSIKQKG